MVQFAALALVIAGVAWALYSDEIRAFFRRRLRSGRPVSNLVLIPECILFGVLFARVPFIRTPVGMLLVFPFFAGLHVWLTRRLASRLREGGLMPPPKPEAHSRLYDLAARHFYTSLVVAYVLIIALLVVVHHWVKR